MTNYVRSILQAPPERLGLYRASVGVFASIYLAVRAPGIWSMARGGSGAFEPEGLLRWMNASEPPVAAALGIYSVTLLLSVCFLFGLYYRVTGPLFGLGLLWVTSYKSSFGMIFHSENLLTLQVLVIAVGPAAHAFSLDARRLSAAGRATEVSSPGIPYGWPLLSAALIAIISYFLAGLAKWKLSGMDWVSGDVLRVQVAYDNLRKIELGSGHSPLGAWAVKYGWLFPPLGFLTMLAELGGPLALLHRRVAFVWTALVVGFHLGVLALMWITFAYPLSTVPFLCLFRLEETRVGKWLSLRL
jgi:hypothetical protein